ncbi:TRAP transporter small permease [Ramlibacter sp.]|uniref:TRAP transporter small permease n=1 Tax=Ramlibacter sp. TaxID=1917967 RepID=UPI001821D21E|nr:TRAP transporter small permease [Ramlibacter sp.]MBA2672319.1 TRAP transporter small permease [Ramlibacter sp.]
MTQARRPPWEERIAVASMALLLVITLVNVATRYLTDESLAWTEEISVFLMVVLALAGASAVGRDDRHIRIEFFLNRTLPDGTQRPRRGLKLFGALATALTFGLLAALFLRWVADQLHYSETSMGLGVPLWWYGVFIPPLCLAIAGRAAMVVWRTLREGKEDGR